MDLGLKGKVALVTAASKGIAEELAKKALMSQFVPEGRPNWTAVQMNSGSTERQSWQFKAMLPLEMISRGS